MKMGEMGRASRGGFVLLQTMGGRRKTTAKNPLWHTFGMCRDSSRGAVGVTTGERGSPECRRGSGVRGGAKKGMRPDKERPCPPFSTASACVRRKLKA